MRASIEIAILVSFAIVVAPAAAAAEPIVTFSAGAMTPISSGGIIKVHGDNISIPVGFGGQLTGGYRFTLDAFAVEPRAGVRYVGWAFFGVQTVTLTAGARIVLLGDIAPWFALDLGFNRSHGANTSYPGILIEPSAGVDFDLSESIALGPRISLPSELYPGKLASWIEVSALLSWTFEIED